MRLLPRAWPVLARGCEIMGLSRDISRVAHEIEEVTPEETGWQPPVLMLEEDRDRVTGSQPWSTLEAERRRMEGGEVRYSATYRYLFRDVLVTPCAIFTPREGVNREGLVDRDQLARAPIVEIARAHHAQPRSAARYFGHFLLETLPAVDLAREGDEIVMPVPKAWGHARQYLDALGQPRVEADLVFVRDLSYVDDRWINHSRLKRYARLHDRVQRAMAGIAPETPPEGVYMWRGNTGAGRQLVNEDAFARALETRGFVVLTPDMTLQEMWAKGGGAGLTSGLEGSQWNHAPLMARRGARHLLIGPADLFNLFNAEFMPATDGRMAVSVARPVDGGHEIDIEGALRLLDRLTRA